MPSIAEIKQQLEALNIRPLKQFGQNFLVSDRVIEKIVDNVSSAWAAQEFTKMIEIGPGLGSLTNPLREKGFEPILLEIDRTLVNFWTAQGVSVIEGDALQANWRQWASDRVLLVSNLPYQISSSIVVDASVRYSFVGYMVLMFQKEVAQRIVSQPKKDTYGLLSVIAQTFWEVKTVADAGAQDFYPPPQIASRVLSFKRKEPQGLDVERFPKFLTFCKQAFAQRRKKMLTNLKSLHLEEHLRSTFSRLEIPDTVRAEELSPEELLKLFLTL